MNAARIAIGWLLLVVTASSAPAQTRSVQSSMSGAAVDRVVELLQVRQGETIAYLGSGSDLFVLPLARASGNGMVNVVDVDSAHLAEITVRAKAAGLENIKTLSVAGDGPPLASAVDLMALFDLWGHLVADPEYFGALGRLLTTQGRLAVIDLSNQWPSEPGDAGLRTTDLDVRSRAAGFRHAERYPVAGGSLFVFYR